MNANIWSLEAVSNAIMQNNTHLEIVFSNYLKSFITRLGEYVIPLQEINSIDSLNQAVLDGIEELEVMRKELLSAIEMFAVNSNPMLQRFLPDFFERLLNCYEELGVSLYAGTSTALLRNDHYRYFNQSLFISLTALLVENQCFDALASILHTRFNIYYKSYRMTREVNFMRFREYNYTLNEFLNTSSPKRVSVTADYIYKYAKPFSFEKLVKADILLYFISLWNQSDEILDPYWYPETSVYNRESEILPNLVSKSYFEKAKILFSVDNEGQYKRLLDQTEDKLQRGGLYHVPNLKVGLLYDKVGSKE